MAVMAGVGQVNPPAGAVHRRRSCLRDLKVQGVHSVARQAALLDGVGHVFQRVLGHDAAGFGKG